LLTHRQTNKQTNRQTKTCQNITSLAEVKIYCRNSFNEFKTDVICDLPQERKEIEALPGSEGNPARKAKRAIE